MLKKTCFSCKIELPISQMEEIGVWVCKKCLEQLDKSKTKKEKK